MRNFASKYANKKLNINKIKDMKRFILALTMLVAGSNSKRTGRNQV